MERSLILSAGKACFVACPGCYNYFTDTVVETSSILDFVRILQREEGLSKVTVAGGDPLSRDDIIVLLDGLKRMGLYINLDTVGSNLLSPAKLKYNGKGVVNQIQIEDLLHLVDCIGIPIDGASQKEMAHFRRGVCFEHQIKLLRALSELNFDICINTVATRINYSSMIDIFDLFKGISGINLWQIFQFMPSGKLGYRNKRLFELDDDLFMKMSKEIRSECDGMDIQIKSNVVRKNKYLLMTANGELWIPRQSKRDAVYSDSDAAPDNTIIGTIKDIDILNKIKEI